MSILLQQLKIATNYIVRTVAELHCSSAIKDVQSEHVNSSPSDMQHSIAYGLFLSRCVQHEHMGFPKLSWVLLCDCPVYQAQRQKLWEKLTSDPDVAAKCQILESKSDEEKLHSMLNEEFWGVDVDEESGLVYGPFKHAFKCIAKYVSAA